jgi:hypothetical protein
MRERFLAAILIAASCLMTAGPALAAGGQFGNLNGTVVDAATKAPIAGASIAAKSGSASYTATTDARGQFTILQMNVDSYTVTISAQGHETVNIPNVVVFGDETDTVGTVALGKALQTIAKVTARSVSSAYQPSQTTDSYTVNQSQILQTTGKANSTNENAVLLAVPGVTLTNAGVVTIRGGATTEVGYQFDGVSFREPFFGNNGSMGLIQGAGSVQVVEGAGDATQGGVGSGVINVIPERGSGPGTIHVDLEAGGPNFNHQFSGSYGFSTPDDKISEYIQFTGNNFSPYLGYHTTPQNQYGNQYASTYVSEDQFLNNFFYKFGKDNHETIQVLYSNILETGYQGFYQGPGYVYYPYDTTAFSTGGPFGAGVGLISGLTPTQYQSLIGINPGTPTTNLAPPGPQQNATNTTRFLKLEYDNRFNPTTYMSLKYFNWENEGYSDGSYTNPPGSGIPGDYGALQDIGGATSGWSLDVGHQAGSNLTISLNGTYQIQDPEFTLYAPQNTFFIVGVAGTPGFKDTDWLAGGYFCGGAGTDYLNCASNGGIAPTRLPNWGINYQQTKFQNWGVGLRFQYNPTDALKFDIGIRDEGQNQHWYSQLDNLGQGVTGTTGYNLNSGAPGCSVATYTACTSAIINNPYDVLASTWTNAQLHPTELQPRLAVSYEIDRNNSLRFGYGRSAVFVNGQTGGTPFQFWGLQNYVNIPAEPGALCGWAATLVYPCKNAAQQLYWEGDNLEAPDAGNTEPAVYSNFDLSWNHQFKSGWGLRLTPFSKVGSHLPAGFILNPVLGIFATGNQGYNKTTGVELNVTTPQKPLGFSGFFSATYQNVLQTTPPFTANETNIPTVPNASLALGDLYRAGYVSPFSIRVGGVENLKNGFSISPQLQFDIGYPYSAGNMIAASVNGVDMNVPAVDFGPGIASNIQSVIGSNPGTSISTNFYDPAFPGSALNPNLAATRGTPGGSQNGAYLSHVNLLANISFQWKRGPNTLGVQLNNFLGNAFVNSVPGVNPFYQVVANGLSGPQTGYNTCVGQNVAAGLPGTSRGCYPYIARDSYAFSNGAYLLTNGNFTAGPSYGPQIPASVLVYFQRSL